MTLFALLSVLVTSGSQALFGAPVWDPVQLLTKLNNLGGTLVGLFIVLIATLSVNIAANVVSPAYDFTNLLPKYVNFRTGALITGVIGVVILPWKLYSNPNVYIFTWLDTVGGLLGAVAGILIADYWILRRTRLALDELYKPEGRYWYDGGWNWRAVASFAVGGLLAVGGSYSSVSGGVKQGPFLCQWPDSVPAAAGRLRLGGRPRLLARGLRAADEALPAAGRWKFGGIGDGSRRGSSPWVTSSPTASSRSSRPFRRRRRRRPARCCGGRPGATPRIRRPGPSR